MRPTPWSRPPKLLAEGRVRSKSARPPAARPVQTRRLTPDGRVLPCRPYRCDTVRCHRRHAADDPAIGQPIEARKPTRRAANLFRKLALLPAGEDHRRVLAVVTYLRR